MDQSLKYYATLNTPLKLPWSMDIASAAYSYQTPINNKAPGKMLLTTTAIHFVNVFISFHFYK